MRPVTPQAAESHPTVRFNAWFNTQRERVVVSPWVLLVPLFCTACSRQLPDFADVEVNRYGHLGTATCPCGAVLNGTAPEMNPVEATFSVCPPGADGFGDPVRRTYDDAWRLGAGSWVLLQETTGYDLHARHGTSVATMDQVVAEVVAVAGLDVPLTAHAQPPYDRLPPAVDRWLSLLEHLRD